MCLCVFVFTTVSKWPLLYPVERHGVQGTHNVDVLLAIRQIVYLFSFVNRVIPSPPLSRHRAVLLISWNKYPAFFPASIWQHTDPTEHRRIEQVMKICMHYGCLVGCGLPGLTFRTFIIVILSMVRHCLCGNGCWVVVLSAKTSEKQPHEHNCVIITFICFLVRGGSSQSFWLFVPEIAREQNHLFCAELFYTNIASREAWDDRPVVSRLHADGKQKPPIRE